VLAVAGLAVDGFVGKVFGLEGPPTVGLSVSPSSKLRKTALKTKKRRKKCDQMTLVK
jgi:hypothetical protein